MKRRNAQKYKNSLGQFVLSFMIISTYLNTLNLPSNALRFLPNATQTAQNAFLALLKALEILDFGSFDELENLMEHNYQELGHLNLAEVAVFVTSRSTSCRSLCNN